MSIRPLPDNLQKVVETELHEVPNRVEEDVKNIKEWVLKQPHLIANTDDQWILTFLRGCKFRFQTTKEKFEEFYTLRTLMPDFFTDRDPLLPDLQELLSRNIILPLPVNKSGPQVFLLRLDGGNMEKLPLKTILKGGIMMVDLIMNENDYMVFGQYVMLDFEHVQYEYLTQLTPYLLKMLIRGMQNAYPARPKAFFYLNATTAVKAVFDIATVFLSKKISERCHFYDKDNMSELKKMIPNEILPREYGGVGDSFDEIRALWKTKMENYRDWFIQSSKYGVDQSKKIINESDYGMEGSFRKLQLD